MSRAGARRRGRDGHEWSRASLRRERFRPRSACGTPPLPRRCRGTPAFRFCLPASKSVPLLDRVGAGSAGQARVIVVGGRGDDLEVRCTRSSARASAGVARAGTRPRRRSRVTRSSDGYSERRHVRVSLRPSPTPSSARELVGARGGVLLLLRQGAAAARPRGRFLAPRASTLASAYAFGGASIAELRLAELRGAAAKPWFASGAPGRYVGRKFRVTGSGGRQHHVSRALRPRQEGSHAQRSSRGAGSTSRRSRCRCRALGSRRSPTIPTDRARRSSRSVKRLKYPSATCIVIDKSDFKLYWVKNNRLVKAYPIAIGRAHMETPAPATWKILAKYHTSPGSVYGPRKMRLFRLAGRPATCSRPTGFTGRTSRG